MKFNTLDYLQGGNPRQQKAYDILTRHKVFLLLNAFDPFLAGTVPIEIDIDGSDLDILCYWENRDQFVNAVNVNFSDKKNFSMTFKNFQGMETVIARFELDGVQLEIFGQGIPIHEQFGYRHLMIEHRLLEQRGPVFRAEIIRLKKMGMKTEPAFAKLLQLQGDPYLSLLGQ
jgi:Domain of unknown function (DUF4269)